MRPNSATVRATMLFEHVVVVDVGRDDERLAAEAADVGRDLVELFLGARGEHDVGARVGEGAGDRRADAAPGAGDDRDLAVEPEGVERAHARYREIESTIATGLSPPSRSIVMPDGGLHAARHLLGVEQLALGPHPGVDGHRGREADLVGAVVDAHRDVADVHELREEMGRQRHREVAVGDRRAERSRFGAFGVDVDPLVVERGLGEFVDLVLGDRDPVGHAEIGADGAEQVLGRSEVRRHGPDAIRLGAADVDASPMAGVSPFAAPSATSAPASSRSTCATRRSSARSPTRSRSSAPTSARGSCSAASARMPDSRALDDLSARIADWVHQDDLPLMLDALARSRIAPGVDIEVHVRVHNEHDGWHDMTLVVSATCSTIPTCRARSCGPSTRRCSIARRAGARSWARARSGSSRSISTTGARS